MSQETRLHLVSLETRLEGLARQIDHVAVELCLIRQHLKTLIAQEASKPVIQDRIQFQEGDQQ